MAKRWEDRKQIMAMSGGLMALARSWWWLGVIFIVLGILGEIVHIRLGLGVMSWLLLAIAAFAASLGNFVAWAAAMILDAIEAKSKKEK